MNSARSDSDDNTTPLLDQKNRSEAGATASLEVTDQHEIKSANINSFYVLIHSIVICIGMYQFGVGIASWGNLEKTFAAVLGWSSAEEKYWTTAITSITNLGAMTGALFSGSFIKFGKLRGIVLLILILLLSIIICLTGNIKAIAVARFFWGLCAGSFSVYCPKYLADFLPIELRGSFGGINQLAITVGIATPAIMSTKLWEDPA